MADYPTPYALDFELIRQKLDVTLRALIHKVEREFPSRFAHVKGAREYILICMLSAENVYRAIRYLAADSPPDPARRPSYLLCVPPLNRTVLDAMFNLVYIFEDFEPRFMWFQKAGWREQYEDYHRHLQGYSPYVSWHEYLDGLKRLLDRGVTEMGITSEEQKNPSLIDKWPNPGQMPAFRIKAGQRSPLLDFLQYLNDWFYKEFSQESHLSSFGALRLGTFVLKELLPEYMQEKVEREGFARVKAINVGRTLVVVLALFSEVEAFFRFGMNESLKYLWAILGSHSPETKEVYNRRYADLLSY